MVAFNLLLVTLEEDSLPAGVEGVALLVVDVVVIVADVMVFVADEGERSCARC